MMKSVFCFCALIGASVFANANVTTVANTNSQSSITEKSEEDKPVDAHFEGIFEGHKFSMDKKMVPEQETEILIYGEGQSEQGLMHVTVTSWEDPKDRTTYSTEAQFYHVVKGQKTLKSSPRMLAFAGESAEISSAVEGQAPFFSMSSKIK
jgi:hypothetical protein